ncbi:MAG TPA: agmatinase [Candidatus Bathyarchaeota archaeon]|nr:agmatinase [Candidatus Bathyarchaeota archaeon]
MKTPRLRPPIQPFIEAETAYEEADYIILGAPIDETASYRRGARFAPQAIRRESIHLETYSPRTGLFLEDLRVADIGDVEVEAQSLVENLSLIEEAIGRIKEDGKTPIMLGGEHTVTLAALRALKPQLVVSLDAHLDLRDRLLGLKLSHGTFMRRALEELGHRLIVLGCRALSKEELQYAEENSERIRWIKASKGLEEALRTLREWMGEASRVYVTIDMDVLDPSEAPAVGNPAPEGWSTSTLLDLLAEILDHRVVGVDVVEVAPHYDSGGTSLLAAYIVLELLCLLERGRQAY